MIKSIPGWINFFLLWLFYFGVMWFIGWLFKAHYDLWYLGLITAVYSGSYLAKWRFDNGEWRFW
jgi:hypothetical protein